MRRRNLREDGLTDESQRGRRAHQLAWQRNRDRAADELFEKLTELRLVFHLLFGAGSSEKLLDLEFDVPIEPPTLHQVAEQAYDCLVAPSLELPSGRLADLAVDPRQLAASLETSMDDLGTVLRASCRGARLCAQDADGTPGPLVGAHGCAPRMPAGRRRSQQRRTR